MNPSRSRWLAGIVCAAALLTCATTWQSENDADALFRGGAYLDAHLDVALEERRADSLAHAWTEYGCVLAAGAAGLIALRPPRRSSPALTRPGEASAAAE